MIFVSTVMIINFRLYEWNVKLSYLILQLREGDNSSMVIVWYFFLLSSVSLFKGWCLWFFAVVIGVVPVNLLDVSKECVRLRVYSSSLPPNENLVWGWREKGIHLLLFGVKNRWGEPRSPYSDLMFRCPWSRKFLVPKIWEVLMSQLALSPQLLDKSD